MQQRTHKTAVILDASPVHRDRFRSMMIELGYSVLCFSRESSLLDNFKSLQPQLLLIGDIGDESLLRIVYILKSYHINYPIIVVHCNGAANELLESNGFVNIECIEVDISHDILKNSLKRLMGAYDSEGETSGWPIIVGRSLEMRKIRTLVREIAPSMAPVLVTGEPGTGKDLIAQALHYGGGGIQDEGFAKCSVRACIDDQISLPSEWLPHTLDRLAYKSDTHAPHNNSVARLTILMDGIEHLPAEEQKKLIPFLKFDGINRSNKFGKDVLTRYIFNSRENLANLVEEGHFNKELYHLLSTFMIDIPPLRERKEDIPVLTDYFEGVFCIEHSRTALNISRGTRERMLTYPWPDNITELKQSVLGAFDNGGDAYLIDFMDNAVRNASIPAYRTRSASSLLSGPQLERRNPQSVTLSLKDACKTVVEKTEKKFIAEALKRTNWNRRKAAKILDISYRSLLNKMKWYDFNQSDLTSSISKTAQ